jgi:hypothetical protein
MRWVFLVAGLAAGLAIGLAFSHREVPRAARPRAPVIVREERAPSDTPLEETQPPAPNPAAPVVVEPMGELTEAEAENNPGHGRIEVDFEGFDGEHWACIARTTLSGAREDDDATPDEPGTVARFDAVSGVCDVWWLVGPRRVGTRVRVVAGRVVRLRAAEFDTPLVPRDLAVLGIHVGATWGDSLPFFDIEIDSDDDGLHVTTNEHGCVNVTLRPGNVTVKVGDQRTPVTLVAGRETVLEISHRAEGDVLFEPPRAGGNARLNVWPVGGSTARTKPHYTMPGRDGFLYVKAGEYEVRRRNGKGYGGGTVLGTVRVVAGRASVFRVVLPPGVLEVSVELPEELARETRYVVVTLGSVAGYGVVFVDQVRAKRVALEGRHVYRARIDGLRPGKYVVDFGSVKETVEVGTGATSVVLRPPR